MNTLKNVFVAVGHDGTVVRCTELDMNDVHLASLVVTYDPENVEFIIMKNRLPGTLMGTIDVIDVEALVDSAVANSKEVV